MNTQKLTSPADPASPESDQLCFADPIESQAAIADSLRRIAAMQREHAEAAQFARPALERLVKAMRGGTGQSYKIRRLLFSLWNGKPADLSDVLCLDWPLRKDVSAVMLGWGFSGHGCQQEFFYKAMEAACASAGILDWFREEGGAL